MILTFSLLRNKELVAAVIQTFKGKVQKMLRHADASSIIEYAYNDKAMLAQRLMMTDELYGNTYFVCKVHTRSMKMFKDFLSFLAQLNHFLLIF